MKPNKIPKIRKANIFEQFRYKTITTTQYFYYSLNCFIIATILFIAFLVFNKTVEKNSGILMLLSCIFFITGSVLNPYIKVRKIEIFFKILIKTLFLTIVSFVGIIFWREFFIIENLPTVFVCIVTILLIILLYVTVNNIVKITSIVFTEISNLLSEKTINRFVKITTNLRIAFTLLISIGNLILIFINIKEKIVK